MSADGALHEEIAGLVSVVMPAYKPRFLADALNSVAAQTYPALELVVCDDREDALVEQIVTAFAATAAFPVHYSRNPQRLYETRSTARGVALARGEFIKFLHDDDVLEPDCIAALVTALTAAPGIALAATRRQLVDAQGRALADELATAFPARDDLRIHGPELVAFLADYTVNFIGEPSAVLCRRAQLLPLGDGLAVLNGVRVGWVADLALYVKLLREGDLAMLARPHVRFRISREQFSQIGRDRPGIGERGHDDLRNAIHALGWHPGADTDTRQVSLAPLAGGDAVRLDLSQALHDALAVAEANWQLRDWQARRSLPTAQVPLLAERLAERGAPRLGIVVGAGAPDAVTRTLASLASPAPLYAGVSVRVVGEQMPNLPAHAPPTICVANAALALDDWDVEWVLHLEAGTTLRPAGRMALLIALLDADAHIAVYADSWLRQPGQEPQPLLRPDFDPELLLHHPALMARHWVLRRDALLAAGGPGAGPLPDLAPALRLLREGLTGRVHHLHEPVFEHDAARIDDATLVPLLVEHLQANSQPAQVQVIAPGRYRIDYQHGERPRVSIVLVAHDRLALLQRCVLSLLEKTAYADYELILLDNASQDPDTQQWLQQIAELGDPRLQLFAVPSPLPLSQARNLAAAQASGMLLLFIDPDLAALQPDWLDAMVGHALRPGIAAVGARTVGADGRITHAGLLPGLLPGGGRAFLGEAMNAPGHAERLQVAQSYSAVAAHCLLIQRDTFDAVGGFDADAFDDEGADIDLCLRLGQQGWRHVWTPHALLLHAPLPAPLPPPAQTTLYERWLPQMAHDPAHHPALRLDQPGGFRLDESEFSWQPLPWRPLPKLMAHPADAAGSGHYRVMQPLTALREAGLVDGTFHARLLDVVEMARLDPDVVIWQRQIGEEQLALMERVGQFHRALKIYELDDYLPNLPLKSVHRAQLPQDIVKSLRRAFARVDRLVVSTPALAEALSGMHADIRVAANRLPPSLWRGLPGPRRNIGPRPRVGWAGGVGHTGDLEMIADVVRTLADEVDWVFMGLCPDALRPYVREFHPGVDMARYPRVLARLDLDLAIAPLEDNRFNACKSNLRLLEYGACAVPVVASDVEPYRCGLPVRRVRNRHRDWVAAIRAQLADADARAAAGDALRAAVWKDWMLVGDGLADWQAAWLP